ncbi:MAG: CPBP family intramembrane glutamic endopeptidase [Pirellulales bacterium]
MDEQSPQSDPILAEGEVAVEAREPPPWGFWLTLVWSIAALVATFIAQIVVVLVLVLQMIGRPQADLPQLAERLASDGLVVSLAAIASCTVVVPILALASRIRGHRVRDYLGLKPLRRGEVTGALATLAVYIIVVDGITWLMGRDIVPPFMIEAYQTAGFLPLLIAALVVAAPIFEELLFRGFAFRGLSCSWPGVWGAILITSVGWAALHVQYDLYQMATILFAGFLLGYWRWKTGSTSLTILMHGMMNIVATLETAIAIEVLGAGGP